MSIQIILDSQSEADQVLRAAKQLVKKYDYLTAADLYELVSQLPTYADMKIGWTDLESVRTFRSDDGLQLIMQFPTPRTLHI